MAKTCLLLCVQLLTAKVCEQNCVKIREKPGVLTCFLWAVSLIAGMLDYGCWSLHI